MHPRTLLACALFMLLCITIAAFPSNIPTYSPERHDLEHSPTQQQEQPKIVHEEGRIIGVRITSSVAVERGRKHQRKQKNHPKTHTFNSRHSTERTTRNAEETKFSAHAVSASEKHSVTILPPDLVGANFEYLQQLRTKKRSKSNENVHPFHQTLTSSKIIDEATLDSAIHEDVAESETDDNVPRARSIAMSSAINSFHEHSSKLNLTRDKIRNSTTTTVSFNIVHTISESPKIYSQTEKIYSEPNKIYSKPDEVYDKAETFFGAPEKVYSEPAKVYGEPAKIYSEPAKVYGEPAKIYGIPEKIYSEPAKVYGEPSKVYSEPAKIYGEPAKIYSEPAKVYAEPSKFYSEPASLNLGTNVNSENISGITSSTASTTKSLITANSILDEHQLEQNFEINKNLNAETNGDPDGGEPTSEEADVNIDGKVGYVLEGQQFRKYRVEERTSDGFIVGEYGVVSNDDGSLRGVRYTADGDTNPRLIYDALVKFLHLT